MMKTFQNLIFNEKVLYTSVSILNYALFHFEHLLNETTAPQPTKGTPHTIRFY